MAPIDSEAKGDASRSAWSEISRAMQDGTSWSGNERNRAWRNLGDGTFADVSTILGLDHVDDGRVVIRTDWDRDGDVDLWLRSRNGPSLRYLENQTNPERTVELTGITSAKSASVKLVNGAGVARSVNIECQPTTNGYLACSPGIGTFGIAADERVVGVSYRARDGTGGGGGGMGGGRLGFGFRLEPGKPIESVTNPGREPRSLGRGALEAASLPSRVVLRTAHPIPAVRAQALMGGEPARLVVLKSSTCATCEAVLPEFLGRPGADQGVPTSVITLEEQGDLRHGDFMMALAASILGPGAELSLPVSALMDGDGNVQCLYLGALDGAAVERDRDWYVADPIPGAFRTGIGAPSALPRAGPRWFHMAPRSFDRIIEELRRVGLKDDAAVYAEAR